MNWLKKLYKWQKNIFKPKCKKCRKENCAIKKHRAGLNQGWKAPFDWE